MGAASCLPCSSLYGVPRHFFTAEEFSDAEWYAIQKASVKALRSYASSGSFTYVEPTAKVIARARYLWTRMPFFSADWMEEVSDAATDLCTRLGSMAPPGALYFVSSFEDIDSCLLDAVAAAWEAVTSTHPHVCNTVCPLRRLSWLVSDGCKAPWARIYSIMDVRHQRPCVVAAWKFLGAWFVGAQEQDPHAAAREHVASALTVILRLGCDAPSKEDAALLLQVAQCGVVAALPHYCFYAVTVTSEDIVTACHIMMSDTEWAHAHGLRGVRGQTSSDPLFVHQKHPINRKQGFKVSLSTAFSRWHASAATEGEREMVIEAILRTFLAGPANDFDLAVLLLPWVRHGPWAPRFAPAFLLKYAPFIEHGGFAFQSFNTVATWAKEVVGDCPPYTARWSALRAAWCGACARSTLKSWTPSHQPPFPFVRCEDKQCCPLVV